MTVSNPELTNRPATPSSDVWLPEDEIDLRQYVLVLVDWWREVVLIAVGAALLAAVTVLLLRVITPPTYESSATVVIARTQSSITFDERFTTLSQDQLQGLASADSGARRGALLGLISNGAVAQAVIDQLGNILIDEDEQSPAYWLAEGQVKAELVGGTGSQNNSDLIRITISADSPSKAAAITNAWAEHYVEQVNRIYGQIPNELVASVTSELAKAQTEYEGAQRELEAFVAQNEVDKLNRLITEKKDIIASLQAGKQTAITTIVDAELQARRQIVSAYINARANNRLLAFQSEQRAKTRLFQAYSDADTAAKEAVFGEQVQARTNQLSTSYKTKAKLTSLLDDAKSLRAQAAQAGDASVSTNTLAILLLKSQVYATSVGLPGNLQVALDTVADLNSDGQAQVADLDALIQALDTRILELELSIDSQSQALIDNAGYNFLESVRSEGDQLFAAIQQQYPTLFTVGDLANLSSQVADDNPLAVLGTERAKELLQLQGLEDLPAYTAAAEPLTQAIDQLESDIQSLEARQEAESSRRRQLAQRRDLAWSTLTILKNKNAELNLSAVTVNSEVRLAAPAVEPIEPVVVGGLRLMTTTVLAGIVGLMLAVFVAFFANFMGGQPWLAGRRSA